MHIFVTGGSGQTGPSVVLNSLRAVTPSRDWRGLRYRLRGSAAWERDVSRAHWTTTKSWRRARRVLKACFTWRSVETSRTLRRRGKCGHLGDDHARDRAPSPSTHSFFDPGGGARSLPESVLRQGVRHGCTCLQRLHPQNARLEADEPKSS